MALDVRTFRTIALLSLMPALCAVLTLALGTREVPVVSPGAPQACAWRTLGKPFVVFMLIVGIFALGNSSDAFLVLRAQERGFSVTGILGMLVVFNAVYTVVSTPAGRLADRMGRRQMLVTGWLLYALVYLGFGLVQARWQMWVLYGLYGVYYGCVYGTSKALIADLVPAALRGTAYGISSAVLGLLNFPASVLAGVGWQGVGSWSGFGPSAPFLCGGGLALLAALLMVWWMPQVAPQRSGEGKERHL